MTQITTPEFPESVHEASVGAWFKAAGDAVAVGEVLLELHTDKAVQEINAIEAGTVTALLKQVDDVVRPGDPLCEFEPATSNLQIDATDEDSQGAQWAPSESDAETSEMHHDESSDDDVQEFPDVIELEVAQPIPMSTGTTKIDASHVEGLVELSSAEPPDIAGPNADSQTGWIETYPAPAGQTDIESAPPEMSLPTTGEERPTPPPLNEADAGLGATSNKPSKRVKLTRRQLTASRRMIEAKQNTVMTTTFNDVDMLQIIEMRSRHGERFLSQHGVKLGFMSFFIKAVCAALRSYPVMNSEIQDDELLIKEFYDIGIAVASQHGLVVPVIRGADEMTFGEIEMAIREFAQKASTGSWSLEDLVGGTFTITNGGVFGSMLSTPILNPPQVGILGMHNIVERPVVVERQVTVRPMMYLALTYDHRIVEGAQAVQFLRQVKESLEAADVLLLGT